MAQSCFCWVYRASASDCIGFKEYNQSDFCVDHLVMSMCSVVSFVVGRGCLLWPEHSLGKTLLAFVLLHFLFQRQTCLLLQVSLDFLLLHSSPLWWKRHLFLVLVWNAVLACSLKNNRMISVHFQGKPFNITVIHVYAPTSNTEEAEIKWFYEDLQDLLELTQIRMSFSS